MTDSSKGVGRRLVHGMHQRQSQVFLRAMAELRLLCALWPIWAWYAASTTAPCVGVLRSAFTELPAYTGRRHVL